MAGIKIYEHKHTEATVQPLPKVNPAPLNNRQDIFCALAQHLFSHMKDIKFSTNREEVGLFG
jgi:hypothetical protein